jgi:ferritin-like metal-binding protein YciE
LIGTLRAGERKRRYASGSSDRQEESEMSPESELMNWLRDAHAMEMQAIQILGNQARRIESYPELRNRILEHLEETEAQAEMLERCIERRGTTSSVLKDRAAAFLGNVQALGGAFFGDEVVKGAITSYTFEHLEIAAYRSLIGAAEEFGDDDTARICSEILRQEEAMAGWLERQLPELTRQYLRRVRAGEPAKR